MFSVENRMGDILVLNLSEQATQHDSHEQCHILSTLEGLLITQNNSKAFMRELIAFSFWGGILISFP